jgi:hypothetical protein
MAYPAAEQLRRHASHARQMAAQSRAEGDTAHADRREADAQFYENLADREEERLARRHYGDLAA